MVDLYADWVERYPIVSIEDGMAENDWEGWELSRTRSVARCSWSATTSSSPTRAAASGHRAGARNSILVKVNQIGTLTETLEAIACARRRVHHGDLAPLGRDRGCDHLRSRRRRERGQIKTGSPCRASARRNTTSCSHRGGARTRAQLPGAKAFTFKSTTARGRALTRFRRIFAISMGFNRAKTAQNRAWRGLKRSVTLPQRRSERHSIRRIRPGIVLILLGNLFQNAIFLLTSLWHFPMMRALSGGVAVDWGSARLSEPGSNAANVVEEVSMAAKKKASKAKKKAPAKKGAAKKKK
jgi:hypothetical protein